MTPRRRVTASLLLLLLLQMMGLGSGVLRAVATEAPECGSAAAHAMSDVETPASPSDPRGGERQDSSPEQPCGLPWAVGCASTAPCLPPLSLAHTAEGATPAGTGLHIAVLTAIAPVAPSIAPELPPPRA